jgi:hypothetical protein
MAAMTRHPNLERLCLTVVVVAMLVACQPGARGSAAQPPPADAGSAATDGRLPLATLVQRFDVLATKHGWERDVVYAYPAEPELVIRAWRTPRRGPALWLLAGIHGEEPAGPNAIAGSIAPIAALAEGGVPIVVIPLANPRGYVRNWRYPATPERDWRQGGYSVGDSEWLLPDVETGTRPRATAPPGPETAALTRYALETAASYPPRLVLDLHEDELSTEGGYIYTQGSRPSPDPVGAEIVRLLRAAGMPVRTGGLTRFGETIVEGVIDGDGKGQPIRDGSIDELLISAEVFRDGAKRPGPAAPNSIVVETPAFAGSRLEERVAAQAAVLAALGELWRLNGGAGR